MRTVLTTLSDDSLFTKALMISTWYSISASRSSTPLFDNRYPAPTQPNPAIPAKKAMKATTKSSELSQKRKCGHKWIMVY